MRVRAARFSSAVVGIDAVAEAGLGTAHQDVDAEVLQQGPVGGAQRLDADRGEGPDGVRQALVTQPAAERRADASGTPP